MRTDAKYVSSKEGHWSVCVNVVAQLPMSTKSVFWTGLVLKCKIVRKYKFQSAKYVNLNSQPP